MPVWLALSLPAGDQTALAAGPENGGAGAAMSRARPGARILAANFRPPEPSRSGAAGRRRRLYPLAAADPPAAGPKTE